MAYLPTNADLDLTRASSPHITILVRPGGRHSKLRVLWPRVEQCRNGFQFRMVDPLNPDSAIEYIAGGPHALLLGRLEEVCIAFIVFLIIGIHGDSERASLNEIALYPRLNASAIVQSLKPEDSAFDDALSSLIHETHTQGNVRLSYPPYTPQHIREIPAVAWLRRIEIECPCFGYYETFPIGNSFHINLLHGCTLQGPTVPSKFAMPEGFVLAGDPEDTHEAITTWLRMPILNDEGRRKTKHDKLFGAPQTTLIVAPAVRCAYWAKALQAHLVIVNGSHLLSLSLADLCAPGVVVLASELLQSPAQALAWVRAGGSNTSAWKSWAMDVPSHTRAMAMCRRHRLTDKECDISSIAAIPIMVFWKRLVLDSVPFGEERFNIQGAMRVLASEDGMYMSDNYFTSFTGVGAPHSLHTASGAVYRIPSRVTGSLACVSRFHGMLRPSETMPRLDESVGIELAFPSFVQPLSADVVSTSFTEFGRKAVETFQTSTAKEMLECPVCLACKPCSFLPCGHQVCAECLLQIPGETICAALSQISEGATRRIVVEQRTAKRCPTCRHPTLHAYDNRPPADPRMRVITKSVSALAKQCSEVWVLAHWDAVLRDVETALQHKRSIWTTHDAPDGRNVELHSGVLLVRLLLVQPHSTIPTGPMDSTVGVVWAHVPLFITPFLDVINAMRARKMARCARRVVIVAENNFDGQLITKRFRTSRRGTRLETAG